MLGFFTSCQVMCDTFRQEVMQTGEEEWTVMDGYCKGLVERHTRACKNRVHQRTVGASPKMTQSMAGGMAVMPFIVPYSLHLDDSSHAIMGNEMAFLGLSHQDGQLLRCTVAMQRTITVHRLPENVVDLQMRAMAKRMRVCEQSALSGSVLYTCVACIMSGQQGARRDWSKMPMRGQCRMDLDRGVLVCSSCHSDAVLSISTLGQVVSLRQNRFYLAPCCCTVQPYQGRGDEFQCLFDHESMEYVVKCCHMPVGQARYVKKRCEICSNVAVGGHSAVDHLTGEMKTVHLCQRHTPHEDVLGMVANWRQLEDEVRRRNRPLFRGER